MDKFLKIEEIAEFLQVDKRTIHRLIKKGMPAFKVGKQWRFAKDDVKDWIDVENREKVKSSDAGIYRQDMSTKTIDVPVVGAIAAGSPMLAEQNIETSLKISTDIAKPPSKYFILRIKGTSMDKANIKDGDLILVKQQNIARDGEIIVALIDQEATVKRLKFTDNGIMLMPESTDPANRPIFVSENLIIQGVYIMTLPQELRKVMVLRN